eukprot:Skav234799  [mRNA]  locus=scaffold69:222979:236029:+ [translate_table: standard]
MSGEEVASIERSIVANESGGILLLKRHLQQLIGVSRFRQRLLYTSIQMEDGAEVPPKDSTLQLVILPLVEGHAAELFQTIKEDDVLQLEALLEQRVDPNLMQDARTALYWAVQSRTCRCSELLIEACAKLDTICLDLSPLHLAAEQNDLEMCRVLLKLGADKDQPLSNGATPLFLAASMGHLQIVDLLIQAAADLDRPIHQGSTPLFTASRKGNLEICRLLVQARADLEKAILSNGSTPLIVASSCNNLEVVDLLIRARADKDNTCSSDGATALFVASAENRVEIVRLLVHAGADKEKALVRTGETPLMAAAQHGYLETLSLTMGDNNWEKFQAHWWGVLHPKFSDDTSESIIEGPAGDVDKLLSWKISGQKEEVRFVNEVQFEALQKSGTPLQGPECLVAFGGSYVPPNTEDDVMKMPVVNLNAGLEGQPGDKYRIRLYVQGAYKRLEWSKAKGVDAVAPLGRRRFQHKFSVIGDHSHWTFDHMKEVTSGVYCAEVQILKSPSNFQIYRDCDFDQGFYPGEADEILGPDGCGHGLYWQLEGEVGDIFQITFERMVRRGEDRRTSFWGTIK